MRVKEIMRDTVSIESKTTVREAAKIMTDKRRGSLLVTEKGKLAGIVTERDVLKAVADDVNILKGEIKDIMSKKIISIEPNDNLDDAACLMHENKIKRLPVIKDGKLIGIITMTDIIANYESLGEASIF